MSTETAPNAYRLASGEGLADVWWKTGRITVKAGPTRPAARSRSSRSTTRVAARRPSTSITTRTRRSTSSRARSPMFVGDERIDLEAGDYCFGPRGIPHAYLVRSERARMLVTISPSGSEQLFVSLGVPVTGAEPPTDTVMPPIHEIARLFAAYGAEILGPPPSLADLS